MKDRSGEGTTLNNIGSAYSALGQKQKALEYYGLALPIRREVGDRNGEAGTLNNMGLVYDDLDQKEKALECYRDTLPIFREMGHRSGEATALNNIGNAYSTLGQKQKALEYYGLALPIQREVGDRSGEATTLNNIGITYDALGQIQKALEYYGLALPIVREAGNRRSEAGLASNIGNAYLALGQRREALEYYKLALPIQREVEDRSGQATTLNNIGRAYDVLGQKQKALEYYERALPIIRELGDRSGEATMLVNTGLVYDALGQKRKALEYYERALPTFREIGDRGGEGAALTIIGNVYSASDQRQTALEHFERALPIQREVRNRYGESLTLYYMAFTTRTDLPERAVFYAKQAVNILQSLRTDAGQNAKLQRSFTTSVSIAYRFLAQVLVGQDRVTEAQQVMDLLKGDEMGRLLRRSAPAGGRIRLNSCESASDDAYNKLVEALAPLNVEAGELRRKKTLSPEEQQRLAALEQEIGSVEAKLNAFFHGIAAQLAQCKLRESATLLKELPPGTVAVYTIAGEKSLTTILYTQEGHAVGEAKVTFSGLDKTVSELREALTQPHGKVEAAGAKLYELLIAPIAEKLDKTKATTIVWSLDGPLRYVPLAVLRDTKRQKWLLEEYRNVVISTSSHTGPSSAPTKWTALGLGVTKAHGGMAALAGVEAELAAVVRDEKSKDGAIPGLRLLDEAFTRDSMEKELKARRPVLHIASHYVFEPPKDDVANGSYLLLGDGSHLTLKELDGMSNDLFRGVDLLTLSACDTAVGAEDLPELEGAEVDGLAFVARQKGADAVMASLWSVNDASTSTFMAELYRRRAEGNKSKAEALQETQLAFLQGRVKPQPGYDPRGVTRLEGPLEENWAHPYFWAPFILIGNWI